MLQTVGLTFNALLYYAGAIALLWGFFIGVGYIMIRWCFSQNLAPQKIASWITMVMAGVVGMYGLFQLLPSALLDPFAKIIVPCLFCAFSFHSLFIACDFYFLNTLEKPLGSFKLSLCIFLSYLLCGLLAVFALSAHSDTLVFCVNFGVECLTRMTLLAILLLQIFTKWYGDTARTQEVKEIVEADDTDF